MLNNLIVKFVQILPKNLVRIFANRYIAGDSLNDAVKVVKELNQKGIYATIDVLGESIKSKEEALNAKNQCLEVLNAIEKENLLANLSIKPTQFGLMIDEDFAYNLVMELVNKVQLMNNFIRLDMEDSLTTDKIFNLLKRIRKTNNNVGVVVQAYLRRTENDVIELNKLGTNYRICKGIYIEREEIAFKGKQEIRDNFLKVLKLMFVNGNYVGIATHDDFLVDGAIKMINEMNIPKEKYEFQMLLGVKEKLRDKLNSMGYKVRIYVPFGQDWYKYSIRRLKENPNIAFDIVKNIFKLN